MNDILLGILGKSAQPIQWKVLECLWQGWIIFGLKCTFAVAVMLRSICQGVY